MNRIYPLNYKVNLMKCNKKKIYNLGETVFCFLFDFTVINLSNPGQAYVRFQSRWFWRNTVKWIYTLMIKMVGMDSKIYSNQNTKKTNGRTWSSIWKMLLILQSMSIWTWWVPFLCFKFKAEMSQVLESQVSTGTRTQGLLRIVSMLFPLHELPIYWVLTDSCIPGHIFPLWEIVLEFYI